VSLAAPGGSDPALLAPVDCHLSCAPPIDELLIDNYFKKSDGEALVNFAKM
jgi:hypothetical protein